MTNQDPLPPHLEHIGRQLHAAAEKLYGPSSQPSRRGARSRFPRPSIPRAPRLALAGGGAGLAAAAAVVALISIGAPPAYALTETSNGIYAITINDIATGVPALNAKLKQLHINITAVPVSTTCKVRDVDVSLLSSRFARGERQSFTVDQASIGAGARGVLAAYRTQSGGIELTMATTVGRVPTCLNADELPTKPSSGDIVYVNDQGAKSSG